MTTAFAVLVLALSLLGWGGQVLSAFAPRLAARWGLTEPEADVDPTFLADVRAEAVWDSLTLWTLPLASLLLIADDPTWPIYGLIGGCMFFYFAGRGIAQRLTMVRRGIAIGKPATVKAFYVFLILWGTAGALFMLFASFELMGRG